MTSFRRPLVNLLLLLLVLLLASSVVKATLNLTLHYELAEDSLPGTVIGSLLLRYSMVYARLFEYFAF